MYRIDYDPKGWDYCELAYMLGIIDNLNEDGYPAGFDEDKVATELRDKLGKLYFENPEEAEEIYKCIRKFLQALVAAENSYWLPVWEGLLNIEESYTLFTATASLLEHMWT